jgi:hypothetical protein
MSQTSRTFGLYAFGTCQHSTPAPKTIMQSVSGVMQAIRFGGSNPILTPNGVVGGIFHE